MILENPNIEILKDGTQKISDSYGNLLKMKEQYGNRFEIEEPKNRPFDEYEDGYWCEPFIYTIEGDDEIHMIFIIPESLRDILKPGIYKKKHRENTYSCFADYVEYEGGKTYEAQTMGGSGDPEYGFLFLLSEVENALCNIDDYYHNIKETNENKWDKWDIRTAKYNKAYLELLPFCVKRIGYLKPE